MTNVYQTNIESETNSEIIKRDEVIEENRMESEDQEEIVPPSKGYNLDFLDKLDDPNFNPFETKSGVTVSFDESAPVPGAGTLSSEVKESPIASDESKSESQEPHPVKKPLPKKPWLKSKKKPAGEDDGSVKLKKAPSKPLPPKPWLKKKIATPPAAETNEDDINKSEEEEIKVPSKGYNLDFLDKLDDPNLNPFETKTAIVDKFEDTKPLPVDMTPEQNIVAAATENIDDQASEGINESKLEINYNEVDNFSKDKELEKKPLPLKSQLEKKVKPVEAPVELDAEEQEEDAVKVPSKGYNLDFLDNLDDPNFNPFETKTSVVNKFEDSDPTTLDRSVAETDDKKPESSVEKVEEKKPKKEMPVKPWLKAKKKKKVEPVAPENYENIEDEQVPVQSKGYNMDFLENLDDPNFNPFQTKTSIVNNFDDQLEPVVESDTTVKDTEEMVVNEEVTEVQEEIAVENIESETQVSGVNTMTTNKGYNLDFLDKLDDPNFNPFETKSQISNINEELPPPEDLGSGSDTTLTLEHAVDAAPTPTDKTETVIEKDNVGQITTKDSTPEFEQHEVEMLTPPAVEARPESPQSNSSGYSSIPPVPEMSFNIPEPDNIEELLAEDNDITINGTMSDLLTNQSQMSGELGQLAKMGLIHEERLLEKDKEVSRLNAIVRQKQTEVDQLRIKMEMHSDSNNQMMIIVDEFEKTIQQLIQEKERSQVRSFKMLIFVIIYISFYCRL